MNDDMYTDAASTFLDDEHPCQVTITANLPDGFHPTACYADIRNIDTDTAYRFTLYATNNYTEYGYVSPGHYAMTQAGIFGDTTGLFPFTLAEDWVLEKSELAEMAISLSNAEMEDINDAQQFEFPTGVETNADISAQSSMRDETEDEGATFCTEKVIYVAIFLSVASLAAFLLFKKYMLDKLPPKSSYRFME